MRRDRYTRYPRPILWLIPGAEDAGERATPLIEPFYISKFPVTNEQYEAFDPDHRRAMVSPADSDPAVGVSAREAAEYCRWYAEVSRKPMRLPTEAEWEHACRAGAHSRFFFGDDPAAADRYLWDADNSGGRVRPAEEKKANGFGLFGMLGGVWEWTLGGDGSEGIPNVLRGGSFRTPRSGISCSLRRIEEVATRFDDAGFRIVKSLR